MQVVYILDQVKALEEEILLRIKQQGLNAKPRILVVHKIGFIKQLNLYWKENQELHLSYI